MKLRSLPTIILGALIISVLAGIFVAGEVNADSNFVSEFFAKASSIFGITSQPPNAETEASTTEPMSALADANGDYRSVADGNWNSIATWERFNGTSWVPAAAAPTYSNAGVVTVRSPHVVVITVSLEYDQVIIESGAQVTVAAGVSHILGAGAGTDLLINGTFLNSGSTWTTSGATWTVGSGGTYIHNTTSGIAAALDVATLSPGSNFIYRGSSTLQPSTSISGRTYSNLSFESSSGSYSPVFASGSSTFTVNGTFSVGSNVSWARGPFAGTIAFTGDLLINGSFTTTSLTVGSGRVMTLSGSGTAIISSGTLTVNGTLKTGSSAITGAGNFTLGSNARLEVGSPDGITTSPTAIGSIRNGGSRTFAASASYVYNGTAAQITGNGLPPTIGSLTVDNAANLELSGPTTVSGSLNLVQGLLITSASNSLTLGGSAGSILGGSTASFVKGPLRRTFTVGGADPLIFPVGKGSFNPLELLNPAVSAGSITVEAEVFDSNASGIPGSGLGSLNTNRYWSASIVSGSENFASSRIRLTDASVAAGNIIGKSSTVNGTYNSIGGTVVGSSVLSDAFSSFSYFVIGGPPAPPQFVLSVNKIGPGKVTSGVIGIDCGSDCTENYVDGTQVTLTATADAGASFTGWSGGVCSGTEPCVVTMNAAKEVTANFTPLAAPTLSISDVSMSEGNSGTTNFDFTVSLSSPASAGGVTFDIATAANGSATAGVDYASKTLAGQTIAAGNAGPYTFTVSVNGDLVVEPNETFLVNVSNVTGASVGDPQGVGTIQNDDLPPTISSSPVIRTAGAGISNSTIANVADPVDAEETLTVTVNGGASATQNGVTVSGISVSDTGVVTADVDAAEGAADAAFTLTVTNSGQNAAVSTLQVTVLSPCPVTGTWTQQAKKTAADGAENDLLGASVAISGDTAVVGAPGEDGAKGAAYIFTRSGTAWTEQAKLTASDGDPTDQFGTGVAISGDTVIAGAINNDGSGSAYIFTRIGTTWSQQAKLKADDAAANDIFGRSVAISGDTAVVGAWLGNVGILTDAGAAYVFTRSGATWTQQQKLTAFDGAAGDRFGFSVAISGDTTVVGVIYDDDKGDNSGSAYVFTRSGTTWGLQQKLTAPDGTTTGEFGFSSAISGDTLIVGAWGDDHVVNAGAAHVFKRSGAVWSHQQKLTASDPSPGDFFGFSVGISGNTAVVGARNDDASRGSSYIFTRTGETWSQKPKLTGSDGVSGDQFGVSAAISGDTAVVGANWNDESGTDSGSAYFFANACPGPPAPEIAVENTGNIQNGGTSAFGDQKVDTTGPPTIFTIRNTGTADLLIIKPFVVSGTNQADFTVDTTNTETVIPAGGNTTFSVTFTPGALGAREAAIAIDTNDGDEDPFVINLEGTGVAFAPGTYTWNTAANGDWSVAANWLPARVTPLSGDTLIIDGNVTPGPTIDNVGGTSGETIARLSIINGADPNLSTTLSAKTLNIAGGEGDDLIIGPGSIVRLTGTLPLTVNVGPLATASITGSGSTLASVIFEDGNHRLIGNAASAITVGASGFVTTAPTYAASSHPFGNGSAGNGVAGSVVFANGSVYSHNAGNSPFGSAGSAAVTVFQVGSLAQWLTLDGFQADGRNYGDLIIGSSSIPLTISASGSGNFGFGNLTVISANPGNSFLHYTGSGSSSINIHGNIRSEGFGTGNDPDVVLTAGPTGKINLSKPGGGTILMESAGTGRAVDFRSDAVIASGTTVALSRTLLMGVSAERAIQVDAGANITGGAGGYVIGSVKRMFSTVAGAHSAIYPVGTASGYSPVEAAYTVSPDGTYDHTVKAHPGKLPGVSGSDALGRYWSLSTVNGPGTATANLTFRYNQGDVAGTEANYKAIRSIGGVFTRFDPAPLDTLQNFATVNGVSPAGNWSLANPSVVQAGSLQFSQAAYSVSENGGTVTLNVTRVGGSDGAVSVNFATANGSATAGSDYTSNSGTLNWAAGDKAAKPIVIGIVDDVTSESSENFVINLSAVTGMAALGSPASATVTINDNEQSNITLNVTRNGNGTGTVTSDPAGINCGTACQSEFAPNAIVTLTAAADTGSKFAGWSGGCTGTGSTCQVTLNVSKTVNAQFTRLTISGKVRLRNTLGRTPSLADVLVPGVNLMAAGTPPVSGSTGIAGTYTLSGFGAGPYTVTPSKSDQPSTASNGVTIDDAALIARLVVGLEPGFTVHQRAAADVSGAAGVTSYDATLVARWVVDLPDIGNRAGKFEFNPVSFDHGAITADVVKDYDVLLIGDVDGDFEGALQPEANLQQESEGEPAVVSLGNFYAQAGSAVVVPLKIENLMGASVRSYQFNIEYDPAVLTPDALAADLAGTVSAGMNLVYNVPVPGLLKVAVYDIYGVMGDGIYANLRFTATGSAGSASPLAVKGFRFNDGKTMAIVTDGSVFVASAAGNTVSGRLVTTAGSGVRGTKVTITGPNGSRNVTQSSSLGYFEFTSLAAGETYTLTVQSRRYRFAPMNVAPANGLTTVEMIALE